MRVIVLLGLLLGTVLAPGSLLAATLPIFGPADSVLAFDRTAEWNRTGYMAGITTIGAADFNGDGLMDVVVARTAYSLSAFPLMILLNTGAGTFVDGTASLFTGSPPLLVGTAPQGFVIADFNGMVAQTSSSPTRVRWVSLSRGQNVLVLSTPEGKLVDAPRSCPNSELSPTRCALETSMATERSTSTSGIPSRNIGFYRKSC